MKMPQCKKSCLLPIKYYSIRKLSDKNKFLNSKTFKEKAFSVNSKLYQAINTKTKSSHTMLSLTPINYGIR